MVSALNDTSFNGTRPNSHWMNDHIMAANVALDVLILVISVLGNLLVIFTIIREKKLQTTCNFLLLHLAVSDISLVTTSIPFDIYFLVHDRHWDFGFIFCKILWPTNTLFYVSGALILTVISLDRYRVFVQTFRAKLRRAQAKKAIILIYIFAIFCVIPYSLVLKMEKNSCFETWSKFLHRQLYTVFLFCVQYAIPLVIMFFVYVRIGSHITRKTQHVRLSKRGPRSRISLRSTDNATVTRHDKARKERSKKALKMIIVVVIVFAAFMLPYQLLWMIADFGGEIIDSENLSKLSKLFVIFSYVGSCTLNPFIYGVGDKRFRQGYRSICKKVIRAVTRRPAENYRRKTSSNEGELTTIGDNTENDSQYEDHAL